MKHTKTATLFAILAAALYALNIPVSKLLLEKVGSATMAAFLYLGAGVGMLLVNAVRSFAAEKEKESRFEKSDLPAVIGMVLLDIAAPILLMAGLRTTNPENASLLNNFEIVATSLIALLLFREKISGRLWIALVLTFISSIILSLRDLSAFAFSTGSLFILAASLCWGLENNLTRHLSSKSSSQIVIVKGLGSGIGALIIAWYAGEQIGDPWLLLAVMVLGFVSYGLSIYFYVLAQKDLGAAKTSAYYAVAPFLGVIFAFVLFREAPQVNFYLGLAIMLLGTYFIITDTLGLQHTHQHSHGHEHAHAHGGVTHSHAHLHVHSHFHAHASSAESMHEHEHPDLPDHVHDHN